MSTYYVMAWTRCKVFTHLVGFSAGGGYAQEDIDERLPEFVAEHIGHQEDLRVLSEYDNPSEKYAQWFMPEDDAREVGRTWLSRLHGWIKR